MNAAPARVRHIIRAVVIWAVVTVVLEIVFLLVAPHLTDWQVLPPAAGDRSNEVNTVLWLFTFLSIPVYAFVVVFAGYAIASFGSRIRPRAEGPAVLVSPRFQFIWIVASFVLVAFLYVYGLAFLQQVDAQPTGNVLQVSVTGEQWLWDYAYPQYNNVGGTTLELPVNTPVTFTITSIDVTHSFWIPAFAIKQDAVPGEITHISATPKVMGDYAVRCAELCGILHAYMETPVHVVSIQDFRAWVAQQQPAAPPPSSSSLTSPFMLPTTAVLGSNSAGRRAPDLAEG